MDRSGGAAMMRGDPRTDAPLTDLAAVLMRMATDELALARAEMGASLRRAAIALLLIAVALLLLLVAMNMLAGAAAVALAAAGVADHWAPALVGMILVILALGLMFWAVRALRPSRLLPVRTAARLRRDAELIKEMMRDEP